MALFSGAIILPLSLVGCGTSPFFGRPPQDAANPDRVSPDRVSPDRVSPSHVLPAPPSTSAKSRSKSQNAALQKVLGKWFQALTKPAPALSAVARAIPLEVSIDVAAIARRHPAWRLADALEHGGRTGAGGMGAGIAPLQVSFTRFPVPVPFGPLQVAAPGGTTGFTRDAQKVEVTSLVRLQVQARITQERAINTFVVDVAGRQQAARVQRAANLRAALDEDVAAARRVALAELEPDLPPDPIQLEMTNLRLDLLRNVQRTPQAREQAVQRLHALEAQWEAKLRSQEAARLEELKHAREVRPLQIQQAGEARIRDTMAAMAQRDEAIRENVLQSHRTRVEEDLTADEARLGITLPAASLPPQAPPAPLATAAAGAGAETRAGASPGASGASFLHLHKTIPLGLASDNYRESKTTSRASRVGQMPLPGDRHAAEVRALRTQAWHDARRWARLAVQRAGWTWSEDSRAPRGGVAAPDRTQQVLRILNLS